MVKAALKFGVYVGLIGISIALLIYLINPVVMVKWWYGLFAVALDIGLVIYFGYRYRNQLGGILDFRTAFVFSLIVFAIAGLLTSIYNILLYTVIDPELPAMLIEATIEQTYNMMQGFGAPEADIEEMIKVQKEDLPQQFSFPGIIKAYGLSLIVYLVISLITGAVIKRNKPEFE